MRKELKKKFNPTGLDQFFQSQNGQLQLKPFFFGGGVTLIHTE